MFKNEFWILVARTLSIIVFLVIPATSFTETVFAHASRTSTSCSFLLFSRQALPSVFVFLNTLQVYTSLFLFSSFKLSCLRKQLQKIKFYCRYENAGWLFCQSKEQLWQGNDTDTDGWIINHWSSIRKHKKRPRHRAEKTAIWRIWTNGAILYSELNNSQVIQKQNGICQWWKRLFYYIHV